jgi:UDP-glucose 4-epimerase
MKDNVPKVLVIGGNGFLGSNIVFQLRNSGYHISVLDLKASSDPLQGVDYYTGSTSNAQFMSDVMQGHQYLIYLKSGTNPNSSMLNANRAYAEDLPELVSVCKLCQKHAIEKIVFASSGGTVYAPLRAHRPYREEDPTHPINHYGIAKLAAENILLMNNKLFGMRNIILRIANPYGMGQTSLSGVGVITTFAERMLAKQTIHIWGNGEIVRDYVEVSDVSRAFSLALEQKDHIDFPVFNIGSGKGFSITQIIQMLQDCIQEEPKIEFFPQRDFDNPHNVLDISKASRELCYSPIIRPETGIKEYIEQLKRKVGC